MSDDVNTCEVIKEADDHYAKVILEKLLDMQDEMRIQNDKVNAYLKELGPAVNKTSDSLNNIGFAISTVEKNIAKNNTKNNENESMVTIADKVFEDKVKTFKEILKDGFSKEDLERFKFEKNFNDNVKKTLEENNNYNKNYLEKILKNIILYIDNQKTEYLDEVSGLKSFCTENCKVLDGDILEKTNNIEQVIEENYSDICKNITQVDEKVDEIKKNLAENTHYEDVSLKNEINSLKETFLNNFIIIKNFLENNLNNKKILEEKINNLEIKLDNLENSITDLVSNLGKG